MKKSIPISCTLTPDQATDQVSDWQQLQQQAQSSRRIPGRVAMTFAVELAPIVEDLAAGEALCCSFLSLTTSRRSETVLLEITSNDPAAKPVIDVLAGPVTT